MKKAILFSIVYIVFQACSTSNDKAKENEETKDKKTKIVITTNTELSFNFSVSGENNGSTVYGTTNLPDSTKIGIDLMKGGKTFAQDFDVFVINGNFKTYFPISYFEIESIEISLIDNNLWQSKSIREQLKLMNSNLWTNDDLGRFVKFNKVIKETKQINPVSIINAPQQYTPLGKVDGKIINASQGNIKRYKVNIDFNKEITGEELDKEIRHWIYYVYKQHKDANAIAVNCYVKGNKMSFMNGYFAPFGEWKNANSSNDYSNHKVSISYF